MTIYCHIAHTCFCTNVMLIRRGRLSLASELSSPRGQCTEIGKSRCTRFGEIYCCCSLSLLPQLAYSIHATWCIDFSQSLYRARLKGFGQVWRILFLLLLSTSASTCLQHSRNLAKVFQPTPVRGMAMTIYCHIANRTLLHKCYAYHWRRSLSSPPRGQCTGIG